MSNQLASAQDPNELFDVVTTLGDSTGIAKRRADVHRDGDWHRSVHVWFVGGDGKDAWIIFQRRGLGKDTNAGLLDASVAGHPTAGENRAEALRECAEEIGVAITAAEATWVGRRMIASEHGPVRDREIQEIFFTRADSDLTNYRPSLAEVDAIVRIRIADLLPVLSGQEAWCWGLERKADGEEGRLRVHRDLFISSVDDYFLRVALVARDWLDGRDPVRV